MFDTYDDIPVGIDLGTTNSCIGYWDGKEVKIIPNRIGEKTTPSTIYFLNNETQYLVGEQSQKYLSLQCQKVYSIKRIIGRDFNEKNLENEIKSLHYDIIKNDKTNKPLIQITQNGEKQYYTPEQLSSFILKKLVKDAEKLLSKPIKKVVISVPAYFDDAQRSSTIEAAKLANLEVIRLINEPTAAALSYGLGQSFCPFKKESLSFSSIFRENREKRKKLNTYEKNSFCLIEENKYRLTKLKNNKLNNNVEKGKNILVFDLGGGTYDLAILQLNLDKKEYEVKSKISDKFLGGDDFDNKLVDYCLYLNAFDKNNQLISNRSMERLRNACEQAKKILSTRNEAVIQVNNFIANRDIIVKITRNDFENTICRELFDRLENPFNELLNGADLTTKDLDEIILVGGSTRMPKVKDILEKYFENCPINVDISPEEVVAFGATIQAAMIMTLGKNKILNGIKLFDITPISLGTDVINKSNDPKIQELGSKMSIIIPKWSRIPIKLEKGYKTVRNYQDSMQICIFEGENDYLKDNKLLGKFTLIDLPKLPKGQVKCIVSFEIDENNILNVTAVETSTGKEKAITVKASNKIYNKQKSTGVLSTPQTTEEKKIIDINYNIKNYIVNYTKANKVKIKLKILENYNQILKTKIKEINPSEKEEEINGDNVERYFFYVYQLFESYEEMLNLKIDENLKLDKQNRILEDVIKYINIFKRQNIYYFKQFIELFRYIDCDIFLHIFLECIQKFNEMGQYYLDNKQKFSRYYSKLYFGEVIDLSNKYKILKNEGLYDPLVMNNVKDEIQKSEIKLSDINTNAISLINKSKEEKTLINDDLLKDNIFNKELETGYTYLYNKINIKTINQFLNNDELNIILDELERINSELELLISQSKDNEEIQKDLFEQQAICLGNIVKIKYSYFKGTLYTDYLKLIQYCLFYAEKCNKNNSAVKWYQDALDLKNEIEDKYKNENKSKIYNTEEEINKIDYYFKQNNKMPFINYILENWPYKGYDKNSRPTDINWDSINQKLIYFLSKQYHPSLYPHKTPKEKHIYEIMKCISQRLNNMLDKITPRNSGTLDKKLYFLNN